MSERQVETTMDHDNKPETGSGQSWIYSSLIQTVRPVASLAANLGILPYSYNIIYDREFLNPHYNEAESKRLTDVWKKTGNADVGFITLHIISEKDNETKIRQIGMTKWRSDGSTHPASVHCQVEQGMAVSEPSYPQLIATNFLFGDTEVIVESDVGPWLDATFRSFHCHQDITCLVGHDIHRILRLVQPHWKVQSDVIVLDTRAIWEFQHKATQHPSFKQTLEGVMGRGRDDFLLDNAGNDARFILEMFQEECFQAGRLAGHQGPSSRRPHGHRSALQYGQVTPASWSSM
ncbi:hypothetical protein MGN70_004050 [Eutypa lata]|nr:hypothetical protein MGN70_004050 [Eutypa lata]